MDLYVEEEPIGELTIEQEDISFFGKNFTLTTTATQTFTETLGRGQLN